MMTAGLLYFPLHVLCLQCELLFDCRCILVGKGGISLLSLDLLKLCMTSMQRVGLNISNDTTASTVEKDAENHSYIL